MILPSEPPSDLAMTPPPGTSEAGLGLGEERRIRRLLVLVLVLAALLRLGYLLEVMAAPDFSSPRFEALYHDHWARSLVTGDWTPPTGVTDPEISSRPYFRPPGYPFFLAAVYAATGGSYLAPRLVQMALGLASCLLLFALGRHFFDPLAGLAAAALYGLAWVPLFFEAELMAPALLVTLLLGHLLALARWRGRIGSRRSSLHALLAGVLLGLAALVRPNSLALVAPALLWMGWLLARRRVPWRWRVRPLLALPLALGLMVAPATWRNLRISGEWVLITSNAGINLFVGTHPANDGYTPGVPELGELLGLEGWDSFDQPKIVAAVSAREGRAMGDAEVSRWLTHRALDNFRDDPAGVLRQVGRKLLLFWGPAEISNNKVLEIERRYSPALGLGLGFASLLAMALAGLVYQVLVRGRGKKCQVLVGERAATPTRGTIEPTLDNPFEGGVLLLGMLAVTCASYLPFFVAARFRVPVVPLLAIFGGIALAGLWRLATAGRWRSLAAGLVVLALLRLATGMAWVPYEPDEALWHLRRGLLFREQGRFDEAANAFGTILATHPYHPEAPLLLAEVLEAAERPAEAVAVYRRILAEKPDSVAANNNLALLLARAGDLEGAIGHWQKVLAIDPERLPALINLAATLATHPDPARRDPRRALELAERANRLHPDDPTIQALLRTLHPTTKAEPIGTGRSAAPDDTP